MPDFLFAIPKPVLVHALRSESVRKGFSDLGARISLYLDVDQGAIRSQRQYAEAWGWSRDRVRYHWDAIWQDVAGWATSHGRQTDPDKHPLARGLPAEWLAWARASYNPPPTPQGAPHPLSISRARHPSSPHPSSPEGKSSSRGRSQPSARARGAPPPASPARPERVEVVCHYAQQLDESEFALDRGRADSCCRFVPDFFEHYSEKNPPWTNTRGERLRDWRYAFRRWILRELKFSPKSAGSPAGARHHEHKNGHAKQNPAGAYERARLAAGAALGLGAGDVETAGDGE